MEKRTPRAALDEATITRAAVADAAEILALQKLAYRSEAEIYGAFDIPPLLQSESEMRADIERQVVLKAMVEGRIVGSVRAYGKDGTCHIGRVIVHPEYQNRGLGKRLMGEIEACFAAAKRFELFTGHRSERNLHLYRKLGYVAIRTEKATDALSIVFMEKPGASTPRA
jgi:ribosomal protein S18 acetylase RimI-like enzyme